MAWTKVDNEGRPLCNVIGCQQVATHTWSGHPTCDECGTRNKPDAFGPGKLRQPIEGPDYEDLLRRYIKHVGMMEGVDFICLSDWNAKDYETLKRLSDEG